MVTISTSAKRVQGVAVPPPTAQFFSLPDSQRWPPVSRLRKVSFRSFIMKNLLAPGILLFAALGLSAAQREFQAATNPAVQPPSLTATRAQAVPPPQLEAARFSNSESNNATAGIIVPGEPVQVIRAVAGGARADYGLQKVFFPLDARSAEALTITTPDGRTLKCRATFLAAHDLATDQCWLIAEVTNRIGEIVGPDQVIYTNAFDTIAADIRYRYTKYSLEQDILLHENPKLPKEFSLDNVRLEVWSEWFDSAPKLKLTQPLDLRAETAGLSSPALMDDMTVDFGAAKIGAGHAFSSDAVHERTPVGKRWERIEGRDWLIEVVDYRAIQSKLEELPAPEKVRTSLRRSSKREQLIRSLATFSPSDRVRSSSETSPRPMLLAQQSRSQKPAFVLDFVIVSSVPVPSGVISWWPGGGNAEDAINASNNDGTWNTPATYQPSKVGQGFKFYGTNKVEIPNATSLNPTNGVTVEAWVKLDPGNTSYADIISKDGEGSDRQYFLTFVPFSSNKLRAHVTTTSGLYYIDGPTIVTSNIWYHVAMTYSASSGELAIYLNGQLDTNGYLSGTIVPTTQPVRIGGGSASGPTYHFRGMVDEPAIYGRALGQSEIEAIYNAGVAGKINPNCVTAPTNIIGWWPGDSNIYDLARTNFAAWHGSSAYSPSIVSDGFQTASGDFWYGGTWLEIPDQPIFNPTNELTLEAWVYATGTGQGHRLIMGKDAEYAGRQYLLSLSSVNRFRAHVWANDGTIYYFDGSTAVSLNTWYHVAMTYNRTNLILYVNGVQDGSASGTKPIKVTTQPVRIGASAPSPNGAPYSFPGKIDEPALYNRALTSAEVTSLYTAGTAGKCKNDSDGDGLTDLQETFLGTNPNDSDSDNDGLTDGDEVFVIHSDPLSPDADGDGVPDWIELAQGRNPNSSSLPGAVTDSNNQTRLKIYTPLR